ncbi:hypothetical protein NA57DRAFT_39591 [Rhizodiscina lignyota]|uniref:UBC core domain-containing protein n=1 Tax=Rhizodiscina lignyota TaxID=1504668 RepID=A0A9P4M6N8_9PEZI|nr:hypothetical protein NA57DRAFT_39591 [Rhizodiscina lignyota]
MALKDHTGHFTQSISFLPPSMKFSTRIHHPNISSQGEICVHSQGKQWSPALTPYHMVVAIISLLSDTTVEDPLVPEIAATYVQARE